MDGERSVGDTDAQVLVVSQFTLYADTRRGRRPSWIAAAPGPVAEPLVDAFAAELRALGTPVATGPGQECDGRGTPGCGHAIQGGSWFSGLVV